MRLHLTTAKLTAVISIRKWYIIRDGLWERIARVIGPTLRLRT